ncbi:MAG: hypothetical protein ACODAC_12085, partial [Pseudomonadota bacterium]
EYSTACQEAGTSENPRRALAFLAAFGTDGAITDDGRIRYTDLDLTSGRQKLIQDLRGLAKHLAEPDIARTAFRTALLGGSYQPQATFGWDPVAVRRHALESRAPNKSTPPGKPGLVWLAADALPLHPVLPHNGRTRTTGCEHIEGIGKAYFWGLWSDDAHLNIDEARFLRALDFPSLSERMGVVSLWASEVGRSGNYGALLPAARLR